MASRAPKSGPSAAVIHVALLRGINVGGKHLLPMSELAAMFVKAGCTDVRTYIQSGNIVFAASPPSAERVPQAVSRQIAARFGFEPRVIVRSGGEIADAAAGNPFVGANTDAASLHVGFLAGTPDPQRVARLDPSRSPGDRFAVRGREIYLHLPNGVHKSKLTNAYIDATLSTTCTIRNWRTVLKLVEMAS